jgi:carbonic anhydrase
MLGLLTLAGTAKALQAASVLDEALQRQPGAAPAPEQKPPAPAKHAARKVPQSPEEIWADLMEGNKRFAAGKPKTREIVASRSELVNGQHPKVIVLGCADSRVSPELVFDKNLGDLFVVRTAGNIADPIALGSIEYAVEHLHSPVLLILGHEKCGAVSAAAEGGEMPTPNLESIMKKIAPVTGKLKDFFTGDDLINISVQANVMQSANDLLKNSSILRKEVDEKKLTLFKAVYRLKSGEVVRLG